MSEMCDEEGGEDGEDGGEEGTLRGDEWLEVAATAAEEVKTEMETAEMVEEKDRDDFLYVRAFSTFLRIPPRLLWVAAHWLRRVRLFACRAVR